MIKIGELKAKGCYFEIKYDDGNTNPYVLYRKYWKSGWHREQIVRYANLASVTWYINDYVMKNDEERR